MKARMTYLDDYIPTNTPYNASARVANLPYLIIADAQEQEGETGIRDSFGRVWKLRDGVDTISPEEMSAITREWLYGPSSSVTKQSA